MARIKMHIFKEKLPFYPPCEVKCGLQNGVSTSACLLGKALTCNYYKGANYLEIGINIGSSAIANTILHLALGYVTSVTIDMGFMVEGQAEDELLERLFRAVRVCQMEMSSSTVVDAVHNTSIPY